MAEQGRCKRIPEARNPPSRRLIDPNQCRRRGRLLKFPALRSNKSNQRSSALSRCQNRVAGSISPLEEARGPEALDGGHLGNSIRAAGVVRLGREARRRPRQEFTLARAAEGTH